MAIINALDRTRYFGEFAETIDLGSGAVTAAVQRAAALANLQVAGAAIAGGATKVLTTDDTGKTIKWDTLTGTVVTLPASSGGGARFRLYVSVLATSGSHIVKVANVTDVMKGIILGSRTDSGNAVLGFAAGATDDTITLNRTTTGSVNLGEWVELEDVASGIWHVKGFLSATGAAFATPFSATV